MASRTQQRLAALRTRATVTGAVRAFFRGRGFLEVETPLLVPSPGVEVHLRPFRVPCPGGDRWLNTSPEYHMKRLLAAGSGPVFQIARAFRAGEHGDRHNPEFSILEWYRPGTDHLGMLDDTCALLRAVAVAVDAPAPLQWQGRTVDLARPPEVLTVAEALSRWAGVEFGDLQGPDRLERFSLLLTEEVEPHLGRDRVTALTDYPADMASLARLSPDDPTVAHRLEVYVAGLELANAFAELTDPAEQRSRMEVEAAERARQGLPALPLDERFLAALDTLPEAGGIALGLDRLVMLLAGVVDVRDVIAFPWDEA